VRLNSYLARAGVASRRASDELIKAGRVTVNGEPGQLNTFVAASDVVEVDGKPVAKQRLAYVLLHKPAGVVTTARDPQGRPTVVDLVGHESRVVPVGRLDVDTTGALLLTNDGPLAHRLAHPRYGVEKVYEVETWKQPTDGTLRKLAEGVNLEDGRTAPARARRLSGSRFELVLHEGRNRQVRRMVEAVGHRVKALHRSTYAGLGLGKLKPGEWRELTRAEVDAISAPRAPRSPSARTSAAGSGPTPRGPSPRRGRGAAAAPPDPPAAPGSAPGSARPPRRPPRRRPA
jgi:23S rRNA pseudouridine2605 synthase